MRSLVLLLLFAAPLEAQPTAALFLPSGVNNWCFSAHAGPLRCQDYGHVTIHAGLVLALDHAGGAVIKPKGAFWASFGFTLVSELAFGPQRHLRACGSIGCGEPFWGDADGLVDLVFRSLGAWVGLQATRATHRRQRKQRFLRSFDLALTPGSVGVSLRF